MSRRWPSWPGRGCSPITARCCTSPALTARRWWPAAALAALLLVAGGAYTLWPRPIATSVVASAADPALLGRLSALEGRLQALEAGVAEARQLARDSSALEALANR